MHGNNELDPEAIIFYYSDSCSQCVQMKPIVQKLESEGYKFIWALVSTSDADIVTKCFADLMSGYVPFFICPATGESHLGGLSESDLVEFANKC